MNVYFISGLGADRRAFERIKLPPEFTVHHLDWIKPLRSESLPDYGRRLAAGIDTMQPFAVVGLSMGGMIAAALTNVLPAHKTILLSSVSSSAEFPPLFKLGRVLPLYKLVPSYLIRKPTAVARWLLGAKSGSEKEVMNYLISHADPAFIKWAVHAIVNWKQHSRPQAIYHIHGSADKILPLRYTHPDFVVDRGSHFMVWTKAGEVSRKLAEALSEAEAH